ncbi:MAG: hypothetical protein KGN35_12935 [Betaproteobacteria bacterium]|nr:hypothetical protein [Betaproteobacteria bacterium]
MIGQITGQRLQLAKMHIAYYALALEEQAGALSLDHLIRQLNAEFKLVDGSLESALIQDIDYFYQAIKHQQISAIDRGGYWKFKAMSLLEAKNELVKELNALRTA